VENSGRSDFFAPSGIVSPGRQSGTALFEEIAAPWVILVMASSVSATRSLDSVSSGAPAQLAGAPFRTLLWLSLALAAYR
jgi:hypothetical protein